MYRGKKIDFSLALIQQKEKKVENTDECNSVIKYIEKWT